MRAMGKTDTGLENEGFFDVLFKMVHEWILDQTNEESEWVSHAEVWGKRIHSTCKAPEMMGCLVFTRKSREVSLTEQSEWREDRRLWGQKGKMELNQSGL